MLSHYYSRLPRYTVHYFFNIIVTSNNNKHKIINNKSLELYIKILKCWEIMKYKNNIN